MAKYAEADPREDLAAPPGYPVYWSIVIVTTDGSVGIPGQTKEKHQTWFKAREDAMLQFPHVPRTCLELSPILMNESK